MIWQKKKTTSTRFNNYAKNQCTEKEKAEHNQVLYQVGSVLFWHVFV